MIGGLIRTIDNLLGRGEAAVTVPALDGALRPNRLLDQARRLPLAGVDCLASVGNRLHASAGRSLFTLVDGDAWRLETEYPNEIADVAAVGLDGLCIAFDSGEILLRGGAFDGRKYRLGAEVGCITALFVQESTLWVANGSAQNRRSDWQTDLLKRSSTGSIWQLDLQSGSAVRLADGLAYPAGLWVDEGGVTFSEAWRHRLVRIRRQKGGTASVLYNDLPGYPGRLTAATDGFWLAVFAPRSQLVEFVMREPSYRDRMISQVPREFWIAPKLRSGRSFYEPLQGGGVKHLGILKPWSPTMSAGLCVKLDRDFQPEFSLHSRADGATHGVTSVTEHGGRVFAAAQGDDVVTAMSIEELGGGE